MRLNKLRVGLSSTKFLIDTDQQGVIKLLCHLRFINMAPQAAILYGTNAKNIASIAAVSFIIAMYFYVD